MTKTKNCKEHLGELEKLKKKTRDRINCGQCTNSYNDEKDLKWHIQKVHGGYCNMCGVTFNSHQYLKTHIVVSHEHTEVNTVTPCTVCKSVQKNHRTVQNHTVQISFYTLTDLKISKIRTIPKKITLCKYHFIH